MAPVLALLVAACGGDGDGTAAPPADERILYEASAGAVTNVFMIDATTGESRQLTAGTGYDGAPAWSPDRSRIIFSSDRAAARRMGDIYTMAPDGSDVQALTSTPEEIELEPKYSPDGGSIAFVFGLGGRHQLSVMDADGSNVRTITGTYEFIEFPAWRRDGAEIYFAALGEGTDGVDILAVHVESGDVRTVISRGGPDVCPHFTVDGRYMTYASIPDDSKEPDIFRHDLSSSDTTGASDLRLTEDAARDDYANPSPDGTRFVYLSHRDGNAELYLMNADGSEERALTRTPEIRENVPDW